MRTAPLSFAVPSKLWTALLPALVLALASCQSPGADVVDLQDPDAEPDHDPYADDGVSKNEPDVSQALDSSTPVLLAAGDIASDGGKQYEVRDQIQGYLNQYPWAKVAALGDLVYMYGQATPNPFYSLYDPSWGRFKGITYPAIGNHEYYDSNFNVRVPSNYFNYWGSRAGTYAKGWYSYNLGSWHIVVLNSMCRNDGSTCSHTEQLDWLRNDLASHTNSCTLAYFHHQYDRWSGSGQAPFVRDYWKELANHHADVVLVGHVHGYARMRPLAADGSASSSGMREFIVGTGGGHYGSAPTDGDVEASRSNVMGVLKLNLRSGGYDWYYKGQSWSSTWTDQGSGSCH